MEIISDPQEMQSLARQWRGQALKIVLVPTMGFFHPGHLSLMEYGRTIGNRLVVSLFVNPACVVDIKNGIADYLRRHRCASVREIVGTLKTE